MPDADVVDYVASPRFFLNLIPEYAGQSRRTDFRQHMIAKHEREH